MSQAGLAVVFHQGGTTGARAPVVAACGRRSSLRRLGAPANARGRPPRLALARYWAASFGPGARWRLHCAGAGLGQAAPRARVPPGLGLTPIGSAISPTARPLVYNNKTTARPAR